MFKAHRATSSMAYGSLTAACWRVSRSMSRPGPLRAAPVSIRPFKISVAPLRYTMAEFRAIRRSLRRLRRLSWSGRGPGYRSAAAHECLGNASSEGRNWAPAGLSEADGHLYFSTGTTEGARSWQDGEGVFQVGPDLVHTQDPREFFAPSDWKQLDEEDLDLGGVTPLPLASPGRKCPCYWR